MKTNLYHEDGESEHVRFTCNCTRAAKNRGKLEIRQTSVAVMVDENVELAKGYQ